MKTIIIPTNFSPASEGAINYAISYFGVERVKYVLVNVFDKPAGAASGRFVDLEEEILKDAEEELATQLATLKSKFPSVNAKTIAAHGQLKSELAHLEAKLDADYIVVGTDGAQGIEDHFLGTDSYDIIKSTSTPVIVIPYDCTFDGIKKMAFAADFVQINSDVALRPLTDAAKRFNSGLELLNIVVSDESALSDKREENRLTNLIDIERSVFVWKTGGTVIDGLADYVDEARPDLIVMLARPHGFLDRLLLNSTVRKATLRLKVPMLILRDEQ